MLVAIQKIAQSVHSGFSDVMKRKTTMLRYLIIMALGLLPAYPAMAQQPVVPGSQTTNQFGTNSFIPYSATNPLPVISSSSSPTTVTPANSTCTDTSVALTAATSTTLITATTGLKSLTFMDIGTNPVTFVEGNSAAVVGNGMALTGASGAGQQGGAYDYPSPPINAVQGISTLGTTVIVKKCL